MSDSDTHQSAGTIRLLGYASLLPYMGLAVASWVPEISTNRFAAQAILHYSAVILAFLGAVHWGRALAGDAALAGQKKLIFWGVVPALLGWLALELGGSSHLSFLLVIGAFALCLWVDRSLYAQVHWYRQLRTHLTIGAGLCLLVAWVSAAMR